MKTVPINGREIRVEGRRGSSSTLLLLRMPVEVWNLLPENPAYSFVGLVTTENLAPAQHYCCNLLMAGKPLDLRDHDIRPSHPPLGSEPSHVNSEVTLLLRKFEMYCIARYAPEYKWKSSVGIGPDG
jgi:hypothetical protein